MRTIDNRVRCRVCRSVFCNSCALSWGQGKGLTTICCGDRNTFYEDRRAAALKLAADVENAISDTNLQDKDGKVKMSIQTLLFQFGLMMVLLSSFRLFRVVSELFDLLIRVLEFEERNGLEASVTQSQALRIHLPMKEYQDLNKKVALMACKHDVVLEMPASLPRRARNVRSDVPNTVTTVAFLLSDLADHPLTQLLAWTIILFGRSERFRVSIYALSEPDSSSKIVEELEKEFKGSGRWIQFKPEHTDEYISMEVRKENVNFLIDAVGNQDGSRKGLRFGATTHAISFLNDPGLPPKDSKWPRFVVDPSMFKAVDWARDEWVLEGLSIFSSWQPPLHPSLVHGVDRTSRRAGGDTFNIFVNTSLDRIPDSEMLWTILIFIPSAVIYFYGQPEGCVPRIVNEAKVFAQAKGVDEKCILERLKFWGYMPLPEHMQRIRDIIDLALTWGNYPGHTSTNACLTAGTPVVTVEGLRGGGGAAGWVPAGMFEILGLAFMVIRNGESVIQSVVDAINELIEHPAVLREIGEHLDKHARAGTSFFDQSRTMDDMMKLMDELSRGKKGVLDCRSLGPEGELYSRGQDGRIVFATAAAAAACISPLAVCSEHPCEEPIEAMWSDIPVVEGIRPSATRSHGPHLGLVSQPDSGRGRQHTSIQPANGSACQHYPTQRNDEYMTGASPQVPAFIYLSYSIVLIALFPPQVVAGDGRRRQPEKVVGAGGQRRSRLQTLEIESRRVDLTNDASAQESNDTAAVSSNFTTYHPFRYYLDGAPIPSPHASLSELVSESLNRVLGPDLREDLLIDICSYLLDRVDPLQYGIAGICFRDILPTLRHRDFIHLSALNWFLTCFSDACGIKKELDCVPMFAHKIEEFMHSPVKMGDRKGDVVITDGTLMDYIREIDVRNPDLRQIKKMLDRAGSLDHVVVFLQYQGNHFCSGALDMRGKDTKQMVVSLRNSDGSCIPSGMKENVEAVAKALNRSVKWIRKQEPPQGPLECGPRSILSMCDLAQTISLGASDDAHRLERDEKYEALFKGKSRTRADFQAIKDIESEVNNRSDRLRAFIALAVLKCLSCLQNPLYDFESNLKSALEDLRPNKRQRGAKYSGRRQAPSGTYAPSASLIEDCSSLGIVGEGREVLSVVHSSCSCILSH